MTAPLRLPDAVPAPARDVAAPAPTPAVGDRRALRAPLLFAVALVALVLGVLWAGASGQFAIAPQDVIGAIARRVTGAQPLDDATRLADATLWTVRFPRVVMALLVGSALAVGGALMQGVFGNPLAEPGIVGVSAGAAAAACIVIVLGLTVLGSWTLVAGAFLGGLVATAVVYATARQGGRTEVVTLVLTGIAVNAVAGAVMALMTFLGTNQTREEIVFWQLGSLNASRWAEVGVAAPVILVCLALTVVVARPLDLLSLGEKPARHLGVDVERLRIGVIVMVAILTSAAVAFTGIIAFVGLVVPHVIRMIAGPGHRILLPASALCGAVLLLYADTIARTAVPYADLPIGLLTSLIGGPFFFYLIRRMRRGAGGWS